MWKRLKHTNIVPLLGITLNPLQLVSAWMPGGELKEYIVRHPGTNRIKLVGVPLLWHWFTLTSVLDTWYRKRPQLPPFPQCGSWGPQGGVYCFICSPRGCVMTSR